jgi:hypothetical protein
MTATAQNGWPALDQSSPLLHTWVIPAKNGTSRIRLRNGSAGFLLAHYLLWYAEAVEPLVGPVLDDWGYAYRMVRGSETDLSNHCAGCAADTNATRHPLGKVGTFTAAQDAAIRKRLRIYSGSLRWGGDYLGRKDEMHVEVIGTLEAAEKVARRLMSTPRGKRVLAANPGQREVILS